ncbi:unnamed protein product [Chrysoparadoxa australica]
MMSAMGGEVALTREAGKNGKLAKLLGQEGIATNEIPCIEHAPGSDLDQLPQVLQSQEFTFVAITSPEAATVFLGGWEKAGKPNVNVACVGKATGEVLAAGGITPVFTPSKADAKTLAAELPLSEGVENPTLLYPASAKARRALEDGMELRGVTVSRLATYDTRPAAWSTEQEALARKAAVAAFGSPSAVKAWCSRLGRSSMAACIGETSANECRSQGWTEEEIFYPSKPGMEGWVESIKEALTAVQAKQKA